MRRSQGVMVVVQQLAAAVSGHVELGRVVLQGAVSHSLKTAPKEGMLEMRGTQGTLEATWEMLGC